ncbi:30S ribosomal protein S9 [Athalassotoga saccharophila]|uniref:30S ribosomal protein S9 n=1 Tax=Athalassotoga saccharophila TaxID=1441386 RepID=UPI0013795C95|nr:30S ribosomal protein S9 [Athalassotoga saccharophila]BBJ28808.1 30S ribosomal protein S9 [Athalassotoga saccharophila]
MASTSNIVFYGTGRRKTAVARVYLKPGSGKIVINEKEYPSFKDYLKSEVLEIITNLPFTVTNTVNQFDIFCRVNGGGLEGQAGALQLGIARALLNFNENLRSPLRANNLLTRDPRMVERKKYGKKKARKSPQYSKR